MKFAQDHRQRVMTGVVGLSITFLVVGYGSEPIFFVFMLVLNLCALKEFYTLASVSKISRFLGMALGLALMGGFFYEDAITLSAFMTGIGFVLCLLNIVKFNNSEVIECDFKKHVIGIFIITFLLSHLIWLRCLEKGQLWIFFLLAICFSGDTFAFYGGKLFGKHKLCVKISPGKTIEGAIVGLIGSVVVGLLCARFFLHGFSCLAVLFLAIVLGLLGQLGDLWESVLKREFKVKDSGSCLPGHGGFLDRMDSLFFATPFLYYFIVFHKGLL